MFTFGKFTWIPMDEPPIYTSGQPSAGKSSMADHWRRICLLDSVSDSDAESTGGAQSLPSHSPAQDDEP